MFLQLIEPSLVLLVVRHVAEVMEADLEQILFRFRWLLLLLPAHWLSCRTVHLSIICAQPLKPVSVCFERLYRQQRFVSSIPDAAAGSRR